MPDYVLADMASKDGDRKKSFEFRMSKKVAELTQVVHMLFTRNHEKEVELEALRDAYEYEIELVIKDAKGKIHDLEKQVKVLEKSKEGAQARGNAEKDFAKKEEEWQKRFASMEKQLGEEKRECQNARDLLIQAQRDIEKLRQCQVEEIARKNRELDNKGKEVERLKHSITCLEKRLKDADNSSNTNMLELRRENEKLQREVTSLHGNLAENERLREQVAARNKQLESEIRALKKELVKRSDRSGRSSAASRVEFKEPPVPEYSDELERLRREVQRYKNELCNREENFNRMFTQQHPVVLDKRAGKLAFGMPDSAQLRYAMGGREPTFAVTSSYPATSPGMGMSGGGLATGRPTTMMTAGSAHASQASMSRPGSGTEDRDVLSPIPNLTVTVSNANVFFAPPQPPGRCEDVKGLHHSPRQTQTITARLPQLGLESRRHGQGGGARLAKPRPLTREMLSAKAGGHG